MAKSLTRDMHEYDTSSNDNLGENFADQFTEHKEYILMTNTRETKRHSSKISLGFTPARKGAGLSRGSLPVIQPQRKELRPIDATLESHKTRENKRKAVMKNYFESKQLLSFTKHLDVMKEAYFEKMKREKIRVGKSLWELEQRKRKIMRQIYDHPCTDVNNSRNPALFYFTKEKTRRKSRKHERNVQET